MSGRGRTSILVEDPVTRHRSKLWKESIGTGIHGLVITPWHSGGRLGTRLDGPDSDRFTLTHQNTGRSLSTVPLTLDRVEDLVAKLQPLGIRWDWIADWAMIEEYCLPKLSLEALEIMEGRGGQGWRE